MTTCIIRKITPEDNEILAKIIRNTFIEFDVNTAGTVYEDPTTDNLFALFAHEKSVCLAVLINNTVAGCAGIYPTKDLPEGCCEFVKFYLAPQARNQGLGAQLMNECINAALAFGYTQIYLESLPAFSKAIGLYTKAGFKPLPAPMGKSGHFGCTIWMLKDIEN